MTATAPQRIDTRGMPYRPLGTTDVQVSALCLGTQTFGAQTSEADAHAQLDLAVRARRDLRRHRGDVSLPAGCRDGGGDGDHRRHLAPHAAPPSRHRRRDQGDQPLGDALDRRRDQRSRARASKPPSTGACGASRPTTSTYTSSTGRTGTPTSSAGSAMPRTPKTISSRSRTSSRSCTTSSAAGKVRHVGVSNETPWGVMTFLRHRRSAQLAARGQHPESVLAAEPELRGRPRRGRAPRALRPARVFPARVRLADGQVRDDASAGGAPHAVSAGVATLHAPRSRPRPTSTCASPGSTGSNPRRWRSPSRSSRPFVTSTIIGATTPDQLATNIASLDVTLSAEVLHDIETAHDADRYPCP